MYVVNKSHNKVIIEIKEGWWSRKCEIQYCDHCSIHNWRDSCLEVLCTTTANTPVQRLLHDMRSTYVYGVM
jgi:hypothetical protein